MQLLVIASNVLFVLVSSFFGYQYYQLKDNLGATVPTVVALYEDSLQEKITSTATSMTLVRGTDKEGNNISGAIGFVLDEGTSSEEFVSCSASGTALTSCTRGISVVNPASSSAQLKYSHRRGASVKISNYPQLAILSRILNGQASLPNIAYYDEAMDLSTASSSILVHKDYVDSLAFIAGSPNATLTVKGISELATVAELNAGTGMGATGARLFVNPSYLASSNYGLNIPTASEKVGLTYFASNYVATSSGKFIPFKMVASASGDILIRDNDNYKNLAIGANFTTLVSSNSLPIWTNLSPIRVYNVNKTSTSTSEDDAASASIPANLLSGYKAIRVKGAITDLDSYGGGGAWNFKIKLKYGTTTVANLDIVQATAAHWTNATAYFEGIIYANNSTSAQRGFITVNVGGATASAILSGSAVGSATENATTKLDLQVLIENAASSEHSWTVNDVIFEYIN